MPRVGDIRDHVTGMEAGRSLIWCQAKRAFGVDASDAVPCCTAHVHVREPRGCRLHLHRCAKHGVYAAINTHWCDAPSPRCRVTTRCMRSADLYLSLVRTRFASAQARCVVWRGKCTAQYCSVTGTNV